MRIRKPSFHLDSFRNTPRIFENDIAICLSSPAVQEILREVSKKHFAPAFQNDRSQFSKSLADQVASTLFKTADKEKALSHIKPAAVSEELRAEWKAEIKNSRAFHLVNDAMVDILRRLHPEKSINEISEVTSEAISDATIEAGRSHDLSRPIDAVRGINTVCAYVPLPEGQTNPTEVCTAFWSERSSSTTIKPSGAFLEFLKLTNISTDEWKSAVLEIHDLDLGGELDDDAFTFEIERKQTWETVQQGADDTRPSLVDVEELVYAIDNCPFGFTPLVSFSMPIEEIVHRDWNAPIKVTGGILGLHDFINGSGDPLRFEGEIELSPTISNMMAAGARANDIASVHGFVDQSFKSFVEDITPERGLTM